jgi:sugar (pentulose or hexulose) kinase
LHFLKTSPLLLCLDIGSSACKGLLVDDSGHVQASCRERYAVQHEGGKVEQDPEILWQAARRCLEDLAGNPAFGQRIAAISLSAQMSSHMLVDREDRPLTRFVSWADRRASKESTEMAAHFLPAKLVEELGASLPVGPSWPFPRLKWWRDHQPELLDRARYLVQPKDWVIWKMCSVWMSDLSSLRGFAHQDNGQVSPAVLKWAGVSNDLRLPIGVPDAIAGTMHESLARECGLPPRTPVILGWNDLATAILGSTGMPDEAVGFDITGTSEHLGLCLPRSSGGIEPHALSCTPLGPAHVLRYGVTSSSGSVIEWYWEKFREKEINAESYRALEEEIGAARPGAGGLLFLPSLNGERAPWFNPQARGVLYGVTPAHTHCEMSRAVLEGITFLLRSIQQRLGTKPERLYVTGGGSAMNSWNQMKADILEIPLLTLEVSEAGCIGAAALGARALGWHETLAKAARAMIRPAKTYEPNAKLGEFYAGRHLQFEKLHRALEPIFAEETAIQT